MSSRPAQNDFFFLIKKHQMNLSLARTQQRNQAGSEPNLHGWAGLGFGPGSFLDSGVHKGPFADLLILGRGEGAPLGNPNGPLSSWMLSSPSTLRDTPVSFQGVSPFLLKLATVAVYCVFPRKLDLFANSCLCRGRTLASP